MRILPVSVHNPKRDVFVRRSSSKVEKNRVVVTRFLDNFVARCLRFINEIGVEYIELWTKLTEGHSTKTV